MATAIRIRPATGADVDVAADLAAAKRAEYERYSPVFWRRAPDDRARHLPFLARCVESGDHASFAAERGGEVVGVVIADRRGAPAPFAEAARRSWLVDDFLVAETALWADAGRALLERVADEAEADGAERLVVVCARRDAAKRALLVEAECVPAGFWWVRPLTPAEGPTPGPEGVEAIVGPAPPVFDPGGPVARATAPIEAAAVPAFGAWAAAAGAVLAIVPARSADAGVADALRAAGYDAASEWFVRRL